MPANNFLIVFVRRRVDSEELDEHPKPDGSAKSSKDATAEAGTNTSWKTVWFVVLIFAKFNTCLCLILIHNSFFETNIKTKKIVIGY